MGPLYLAVVVFGACIIASQRAIISLAPVWVLESCSMARAQAFGFLLIVSIICCMAFGSFIMRSIICCIIFGSFIIWSIIICIIFGSVIIRFIMSGLFIDPPIIEPPRLHARKSVTAIKAKRHRGLPPSSARGVERAVMPAQKTLPEDRRALSRRHSVFKKSIRSSLSFSDIFQATPVTATDPSLFSSSSRKRLMRCSS